VKVAATVAVLVVDLAQSWAVVKVADLVVVSAVWKVAVMVVALVADWVHS
jgi:hypothetical protein